MKKSFYVFLCETFIDISKPKRKAVYEFDSIDAATAAWHSYMGTSMNNVSVKHVCCSILGDDGFTLRADSWTRPNTLEEDGLNI